MKYIQFLILPFILIACGGGGDGGSIDPDTNCNVVVSELTNGDDINNINSYYDCVSHGQNNFRVSFYDDGTGVSSDIGSFTWQEVNCGEFAVQSGAAGDFRVFDIAGSTSSNIFTYKQEFPNEEPFSVSCTRQNI